MTEDWDKHRDFDRWFTGSGTSTAPTAPSAAAVTTVDDWERTLTEQWPEPMTLTHRHERTGVPQDDALTSKPTGGAASSEPTPSRTLAKRRWTLVVSAAIAVLAAAVGWSMLAGSTQSDPDAQASTLGATTSIASGPTPLTAQSNPRCATERDGALMKGTAPNYSGDGPDLVLQFQHAFYDLRSGDTARTVVAADADVPPVEMIQQGIEATPVGTWHCLTIVAIALDRLAVELTEHRPDGAVNVYKQLVTTGVRDGRLLITSIGQG